jgi:hypothetical protein
VNTWSFLILDFVIINFLFNDNGKLFVIVFFLHFSHHHNDLKRACEGVWESLLFVCNARFNFIELLVEKIIVTLMKFLDLDDAIKNIKQM